VGARVRGHRSPACLRLSLSSACCPFPLVARLSPNSVHFSSHYEVKRAENVINSSGKLVSTADRSPHRFARRGSALLAPYPASGLRASGLTRCHERSSAVHRDDDPSFTQQCHRVPHGGVRNPVLFGEAPLAGQLRRDLALNDPPLDIVRNLNIGIFSPKGINRTSRHMINIGCSLSCQNTD
jgi:hypothetical protein